MKHHRYKEAEVQYERAFKIRRKTLGASHTKTLVSMDELAFIAAKQGDDRKSERIYREVLALREAKLGLTHLTTLTSVNNLACTIQNISNDRLDEAETLHRRAFEGRLAALGPKDSKTVKSMRYLKDLLVALGRADESRALSRRFQKLQSPQRREREAEEDPESDEVAGPNTPTTESDPMDGVVTQSQPTLIDLPSPPTHPPRLNSIQSSDLLTPSTEQPAAPEVADRSGAASVIPNLSMPPPGPPPPLLTPQSSQGSMLTPQSSQSSKHRREPSIPELVMVDLPERLKSRPSSFQEGVRTPRQATPEMELA